MKLPAFFGISLTHSLSTCFFSHPQPHTTCIIPTNLRKFKLHLPPRNSNHQFALTAITLNEIAPHHAGPRSSHSFSDSTSMSHNLTLSHLLPPITCFTYINFAHFSQCNRTSLIMYFTSGLRARWYQGTGERATSEIRSAVGSSCIYRVCFTCIESGYPLNNREKPENRST